MGRIRKRAYVDVAPVIKTGKMKKDRLERKQAKIEELNETIKERKDWVEEEKSKAEGKNHLFDLTDDCLLDIVSRLDHNDFDALSMLSMKLYSLTESSRSKARHIDAVTLGVVQLSKHKFDVTMTYKCAPKKWYSVNLQQHQNYDTNRLINNLKRHAFKRGFFREISIDEHFLEFFEQANFKQSSEVHFHNCKVDNNLGRKGKHRFASWLLATQATSLKLTFNDEIPFIDLAFLKGYARDVSLLDLAVFDNDNSPPLRPDDNFADTLARFDTLYLPHLVVSTDLLMASLKMRLRRGKEGRWNFAVVREVTREDIERALEPDLEISNISDTRHAIRISGTRYKVDLEIRRSGQDKWEIVAYFIFSKSSLLL